MPYKEKPIEKLYYTIGEVAAMLEVKPSMIRFWEKEFQSLQPKKNKKGNRLFTADDINQLKAIYQLVKEKGYKLDGAKKALSGEAKAVNEKDALKKQLLNIKEQLLSIKSLLKD